MKRDVPPSTLKRYSDYDLDRPCPPNQRVLLNYQIIRWSPHTLLPKVSKRQTLTINNGNMLKITRGWLSLKIICVFYLCWQCGIIFKKTSNVVWDHGGISGVATIWSHSIRSWIKFRHCVCVVVIQWLEHWTFVVNSVHSKQEFQVPLKFRKLKPEKCLDWPIWQSKWPPTINFSFLHSWLGFVISFDSSLTSFQDRKVFVVFAADWPIPKQFLFWNPGILNPRVMIFFHEINVDVYCCFWEFGCKMYSIPKKAPLKCTWAGRTWISWIGTDF